MAKVLALALLTAAAPALAQTGEPYPTYPPAQQQAAPQTTAPQATPQQAPQQGAPQQGGQQQGGTSGTVAPSVADFVWLTTFADCEAKPAATCQRRVMLPLASTSIPVVRWRPVCTTSEGSTGSGAVVFDRSSW